MNSINISQKAKNKHLNFSHYEFIINSLIQFNASHPGKRNIGKTQFIKELASTVGTTVGSLTVVFIFSLTKSLKTLIISMLLSFFIVKFAKINVLIWANVCYNRHRR